MGTALGDRLDSHSSTYPSYKPFKISYRRKQTWLGIVAHAFNPSTWEAEAGGSMLNLRPAWSIKQVLEQTGLQRETLKKKKKRGRWCQGEGKNKLLRGNPVKTNKQTKKQKRQKKRALHACTCVPWLEGGMQRPTCGSRISPSSTRGPQE